MTARTGPIVMEPRATTPVRRIVVGIRRVIDHSVRIHLRPDGSGVVTDGVRMSINPFCEIAVEEALRLREQEAADEVVVVSIGPGAVVQQLRSALAMGADRAIHVEAAQDIEPPTIARALHAIAGREAPLLVLLGKQSIDADNSQTGPMLAALWQRPQATFASRISIADGRVVVEREIDRGIEVLELDLPAVVTTDLRLNEPRYVRLPELLKAKKRPIETLPLAALGVEDVRRFRMLETLAPPARPAGRRVETVEALIAALEDRGLL